MSELRARAELEAAWVAIRAKQYRDDGATIPEPLRRLGELASVALIATFSDAMNGDAEAVRMAHESVKAIHAAAGGGASENAYEAVLRVVGERQEALRLADERGTRLADAVSALKDAASVLGGVSDSILAGRDTRLPVKMQLSTPLVPSYPGSIVADAPLERHPIRLVHGIVIAPRSGSTTAGLRVTFAEIGKDDWRGYQINDDGSLGAPVVMQDVWWTEDSWEIVSHAGILAGLPKYWAETAMPAPVPANGAPAVEQLSSNATSTVAAKPKIADWTPDATIIAKNVAALGKAIKGANVVGITVDEALVQSLVARFKKERGSEESQNVGVAFYHYAVKTLKG